MDHGASDSPGPGPIAHLETTECTEQADSLFDVGMLCCRAHLGISSHLSLNLEDAVSLIQSKDGEKLGCIHPHPLPARAPFPPIPITFSAQVPGPGVTGWRLPWSMLPLSVQRNSAKQLIFTCKDYISASRTRGTRERHQELAGGSVSGILPL